MIISSALPLTSNVRVSPRWCDGRTSSNSCSHMHSIIRTPFTVSAGSTVPPGIVGFGPRRR